MDKNWEFFGFESEQEGQPVQAWLDGLPDEHRDVIKTDLAYLQVLPRAYWERPLFDPLEGEEPIEEFEDEEGISEIRFDRTPNVQGGFHHYRIYGCFFEEDRAYVFLHGTDKDRRNDKRGKKIAKKRLRGIYEGQATAHPIRLDQVEPLEEPEQGP